MTSARGTNLRMSLGLWNCTSPSIFDACDVYERKPERRAEICLTTPAQILPCIGVVRIGGGKIGEGPEIGGMASGVSGGLTPGRLVLSSRAGTRSMAAMITSNAITFPSMSRSR